jgi:hypothetical protein
MFAQGVGMGFFGAMIVGLMISPSTEKVVEVLPEEYYIETNVQDTVCMGPWSVEVAGSTVKSRRIIAPTN